TLPLALELAHAPGVPPWPSLPFASGAGGRSPPRTGRSRRLGKVVRPDASPGSCRATRTFRNGPGPEPRRAPASQEDMRPAREIVKGGESAAPSRFDRCANLDGWEGGTSCRISRRDAKIRRDAEKR